MNESKKPSIIAISGKSGCGNTTVSRIVAERLGRRFINYTFRALAEEQGKSLSEILSLAERDDRWDRMLDEKQVLLASEGDCVIGSRLAMWLIPDADLKVYLKAGQSARVDRIWSREGGAREAIARFTAERDRHDHLRYKEIYGIDTDDLSGAHLVIDTERWSPSRISDIIVSAISDRRYI